jgi:hypothetical protein
MSRASSKTKSEVASHWRGGFYPRSSKISVKLFASSLLRYTIASLRLWKPIMTSRSAKVELPGRLALVRTFGVGKLNLDKLPPAELPTIPRRTNLELDPLTLVHQAVTPLRTVALLAVIERKQHFKLHSQRRRNSHSGCIITSADLSVARTPANRKYVKGAITMLTLMAKDTSAQIADAKITLIS